MQMPNSQRITFNLQTFKSVLHFFESLKVTELSLGRSKYNQKTDQTEYK